MVKVVHGNGEDEVNQNLCPLLKDLMEEYHDLFEELNELPPKREFGHQIPLHDGSKVVNLRPYRHSSLQKAVLEDMVRELLSSGVIR